MQGSCQTRTYLLHDYIDAPELGDSLLYDSGYCVADSHIAEETKAAFVPAIHLL